MCSNIVDIGERHSKNTLESAAEVFGGRIIAHYQALFDLKSHKICGLEALLRVDVGGEARAVSCATINNARRATDLAKRMATSLIDDYMFFSSRGFEASYLSINVAPSDLAHPEFAHLVAGHHKRLGLPGVLVLEINEMTKPSEQLVQRIETLRALGARIALDDFTKWQGGLEVLASTRIDYLKFDRDWIAQINRSSRHRTITEAMIAIARQYGISTVAEGIETFDEHNLASALGFDLAQGYLYCRPFPRDQFIHQRMLIRQ